MDKKCLYTEDFMVIDNVMEIEIGRLFEIKHNIGHQYDEKVREEANIRSIRLKEIRGLMRKAKYPICPKIIVGE